MSFIHTSIPPNGAPVFNCIVPAKHYALVARLRQYWGARSPSVSCKLGMPTYRQIAALLRQEGWPVGKRQVQRLRRAEGLRVPPTKRKLVRRDYSTGLPTAATHRSHVST
jgi:hypothetical protein